MHPSNDTSIACAVPDCTKPATIATYILRPYGGKNNVIDAYRDPACPYLCPNHAAANHLGPSFTKAAAHNGIQVYEPISSEPLTTELLRHLPKMPAFPRRGGFPVFQRRAWAAFHAGDNNERFRLALRSGRLKTLVAQLDLTLPEPRRSTRSQASASPKANESIPGMKGSHAGNI